MIGRYRDYIRSVRQDIADIRRTALQISLEVDAHSGSLRVDEVTPRIDALRGNAEPALSAGAFPWMSKAVFDARPIIFNGQEFAFFCGQPSYNTSADLVVGVAKWDGSRYVPADRPCIYPTDEKFGIDIPSFCVHDNRIIAVYFDNYGLGRTKDCRSRNLVVCWSSDGAHFTKRQFAQPLVEYPYPNMGLPWIESVDGELFLTVRSTPREKNIVSRGRFDLETGRCSEWQHAELSRTTINVASVTDGDRIHIFHGYTVGGGLYVTTLDAASFQPVSDVMLVDNTLNQWDWNMRKVCASPWRHDDDLVVLYTSTTSNGRVEMMLSDLRRAHQNPA